MYSFFFFVEVKTLANDGGTMLGKLIAYSKTTLMSSSIIFSLISASLSLEISPKIISLKGFEVSSNL
jgi:hypothetical protein